MSKLTCMLVKNFVLKHQKLCCWFQFNFKMLCLWDTIDRYICCKWYELGLKSNLTCKLRKAYYFEIHYRYIMLLSDTFKLLSDTFSLSDTCWSADLVLFATFTWQLNYMLNIYLCKLAIECGMWAACNACICCLWNIKYYVKFHNELMHLNMLWCSSVNLNSLNLYKYLTWQYN